MTLTAKQYQTIKLATVIVLAVAISQSVFYGNYLMPIALLIAASLALMLLRRKVKEVMADERDYATGGRAALLAIQIYSWAAVAGMFVLYALRDTNPAYEAVGLTLAYSTCALMLLYGVIFRYYNRFSLSSKRRLYVVFAALLFLALAVFGLRLFSGEDDWICQGGQWVRHGQPSFPAPSVPCR